MTWQVLLTTGGNDGYPKYDPLDTTELLVPGSSSWLLLTSLLPRPMTTVSVATLDNKVLLTGGCMCIVIKRTSCLYWCL